MDRDEIKEKLKELAEKKTPANEVFEFVKNEGMSPDDFSNLLDEMLSEEIGTTGSKPLNKEGIKLIMREMIVRGVPPEEMWVTLAGLNVSPKMRVDLLKEVYVDELKNRESRKPEMFKKRRIYTAEEIERDEIRDEDRIRCIKCGYDVSRLKVGTKNCPDCQLPMIKIYYNLLIKEGVPKDLALSKLKENPIFTQEEKDML